MKVPYEWDTADLSMWWSARKRLLAQMAACIASRYPPQYSPNAPSAVEQAVEICTEIDERFDKGGYW